MWVSRGSPGPKRPPPPLGPYAIAWPQHLLRVKSLGSPFKGLGLPFKGLDSPFQGLGSSFQGLSSPFKGLGLRKQSSVWDAESRLLRGLYILKCLGIPKCSMSNELVFGVCHLPCFQVSCPVVCP